jgi:secondary thiamine-phosphate synthase enzyme
MKIVTELISLKTKGNPDLIDISAQAGEALAKTKLKEGQLSIFVVGSTAALCTFEYEPGLIKDMQDLYEKLVPQNKSYAHDETWGDANGFSHLRSALQGTSLVIPFSEGKLLLGTWQQIVLAEFDIRARTRKVVLQFIGE